MLKIGAALQSIRVRAGMTQEELAESLHLSQSDISKIEKDHKLPSLDIFYKWTEVTNAKEVLVAYLCGMDGIMIMQKILQILGG